MYQFTVEADTASDLRAKLLDLARVLAAGEDSAPVLPDAWFDRAAVAAIVTPPAEQEHRTSVVTPPPVDAQPAAAPPPPAAPAAVDAEALRTKLRAALSPLMTGPKAADAKALLAPFGSVSKIPVDQLADVVAKAEALA